LGREGNTVGDQAAATIARSFAIYGEAFFSAVIASLGRLAGRTVEEVIRALSDGFNIALQVASQFITDAGYTLAAWIAGIESWINESLDFFCVIEISNRGGPYELVRETTADKAPGRWSHRSASCRGALGASCCKIRSRASRDPAASSSIRTRIPGREAHAHVHLQRSHFRVEHGEQQPAESFYSVRQVGKCLGAVECAVLRSRRRSSALRDLRLGRGRASPVASSSGWAINQKTSAARCLSRHESSPRLSPRSSDFSRV